MTPAPFALVGDMLRHHAAVRPEAIAMVAEDRVTTYGTLADKATGIAASMSAAGLKPGDRVAYVGKNSDLYFQLLFGAVLSGVVIVAVNWRLTAIEIEYILSDSGSRIAFTEPEFEEQVELAARDCPSLNEVVRMTSEAFRLWATASAADYKKPALLPSDVVLQMYTSGTTGQPKGAMLTHAGIMAQRASEAAEPAWEDWTPADRALVAMPVFHIGGTGWAMIGFFAGATNVIHATPVAEDILDAVERHHITRMFLVPSVLLTVVAANKARPRPLTSVRTIVYGASPISEPLLRDSLLVMNCAFIQQYGMTEATGSVTCLPPEDHSLAMGPRMRSCGRALPGVDIQIRDADGAILGAGQTGEICLRTPTLMKGYWNRPKATADALRDGWYRSGDIGFLDPDGYLYLVDRLKDMIITGGENVYSTEVELAICSCPGIVEAAVIGVPDAKWGEAVKAIVVRGDPALGRDALMSHLRERLAGYKLPKSIDFVTSLPRNASGKLLKHVIRQPFWEGASRHVR
jgi:acyl-CoA synthetase (AMP-forming)/AMP-acid ligase II